MYIYIFLKLPLSWRSHFFFFFKYSVGIFPCACREDKQSKFSIFSIVLGIAVTLFHTQVFV